MSYNLESGNPNLQPLSVAESAQVRRLLRYFGPNSPLSPDATVRDIAEHDRVSAQELLAKPLGGLQYRGLAMQRWGMERPGIGTYLLKATLNLALVAGLGLGTYWFADQTNHNFSQIPPLVQNVGEQDATFKLDLIDASKLTPRIDLTKLPPQISGVDPQGALRPMFSEREARVEAATNSLTNKIHDTVLDGSATAVLGGLTLFALLKNPLRRPKRKSDLVRGIGKLVA